ncbi:MAG: hypothetical protein DRG87_04425 [Deltaproteobacteria bacterium]|nr:heavy-metal-associated domain-containing protein [Deltaproteobacteria bacterium]MBW2078361.1 heavy-metal-associated domain-containing protein [Deltaproteobacteria bacterium]MBW2311589.1 heavy-metal-associated domain-containing protein [Deltaproteobacteria bacterium]RLB30690.1 MAG: hypothetical protein DRG87_04425 [Deltaproteobacteria bacterium]
MLKEIDGVHRIGIDIPLHLVTITFDEKKTSVDQIIKALSKHGYRLRAAQGS